MCINRCKYQYNLLNTTQAKDKIYYIFIMDIYTLVYIFNFLKIRLGNYHFPFGNYFFFF